MNKSFLGIGIIVMGVVALLLIGVFTNFSTGGELDYYLVKETAEASIEDALDDDFYTEYGLYRLDKDKFAESFLRRFAENVDGTRSYEIKIIDLNEVPPKVTVQVNSDTALSFNKTSAKISTSIDEIVEANSTDDLYTRARLKN